DDGVYERHLLYAANLREDRTMHDPELHLSLRRYNVFQKENESQINQAINTAILHNGPVHINIPFEEPLYHSTDNQFISPENVAVANLEWDMSDKDLLAYSDIWNNAKKKMILVGVNSPDEIDQGLLE